MRRTTYQTWNGSPCSVGIWVEECVIAEWNATVKRVVVRWNRQTHWHIKVWSIAYQEILFSYIFVLIFNSTYHSMIT